MRLASAARALIVRSRAPAADRRLEDMTDRDWRIFREDFEISTKGNMRHPATGTIRCAERAHATRGCLSLRKPPAAA